MADDKREERRGRIEAAAFEVLEEMGYRKASMLQIAMRARASNETLYAWYGNKQTLFSTIIEDNASVLKKVLEEAIAGDDDAAHSLESIGRLLLAFTTTQKAIIINRAAVADVSDTGLLAQSIEKNARRVMYDRLQSLMAVLEDAGQFDFRGDIAGATGVFIDLLLGELQLQQALGSVPPLTEDRIATRASEATRLFRQLFAVS